MLQIMMMLGMMSTILESAWELCGDFAVNAAMGPIYTSPLTILANQN